MVPQAPRVRKASLVLLVHKVLLESTVLLAHKVHRVCQAQQARSASASRTREHSAPARLGHPRVQQLFQPTLWLPLVSTHRAVVLQLGEAAMTLVIYLLWSIAWTIRAVLRWVFA